MSEERTILIRRTQPFSALLTRTDFSFWRREVLEKFAREAADKLHERNADADRFITLANIALSRDEQATARFNEICPNPKNIHDVRAVLDQIQSERDNG